ncbi:MAG: mechanosensitive ion channel, partial [Phycisphaerae bacterium]|nr:mechanosensitive ion channel [Phycisphaerae bacterium]
GGKPLSGIVGLVVHVLILIPVLIAALNALELEAITKPASNMLTMILEAIPLIFAAIIVLGFSFVVGRIVAGLVSNLLAGTGFDSLPSRLGLGQMSSTGTTTPSSIVGTIVLAGIMLFAVTEACQLLNFEQLSLTVRSFTDFAGHVLLGLVILVIGVFLANLAAKAVQATGSAQASTIALVVRVAILVLVGAMGLSQMGLADEIIQDGFTILLGATGLAAALAFGLGGRDYVAKRLPDWASSVDPKRTSSRKKTKSS